MEKFNENLKFFNNRFSFSQLYKLYYRVKNFTTKAAKIWGGGEDYTEKLSLKYGGNRPHGQHPRQRTPWTLVVLYAVRVRLSIGYSDVNRLKMSFNRLIIAINRLIAIKNFNRLID